MTLSNSIAKSLFELDYEIITYVPGFGANQTFDAIKSIYNIDFDISYHEEVAASIAAGAAITGKRSAIIIKTHGLMKAMNCVLYVMTCGINSSMLFILFDDKSGSHSDNIFNPVPIINGANLPLLISDSRRIINDIVNSTGLSEYHGLPYFITIDADSINDEIEMTIIPESKPKHKKYERNIYRHLVTPILAQYQFDVLSAKSEGREYTFQKPDLPVIPDELPLDWQKIILPYIPFFDVFKKYRGDIVVGDTSLPTLFALEPYNCIDITLHMGGSIPTAIGAYLAGNKHVWAITGDFAFIACGNLGLIEAINRNVAIKVVIFDNGKSGATGGQPLHPGLTRKLLESYAGNVTKIELVNTGSEKLDTILSETAQSNQLEILHLIV